jgi:hypothetical protein
VRFDLDYSPSCMSPPARVRSPPVVQIWVFTLCYSMFLNLCAWLVFSFPSVLLFFFGGAGRVLIQSSDFLQSPNPITRLQAYVPFVLVPSSACDFRRRLKSCSRWILCRSARRCPGLLSVRCSRGVLHSRVLVQVPTAPEVVSCSVLQFTISWVINSRARSWFARFSDPVLVSFAGL